jgi:hypothetical protein
MRLRFSSFSLSHIAQAIASGRCPFYQGIVPLCFSPHFVVPALAGVVIVFNSSSRPFFNKTPKYMPKMKKTIKQSAERASSLHRPHPSKGARMLTGPPRASPKQPPFLSPFSISLPVPAH